MDDVYCTIERPAEGIYREKGSRFIAFGYPVSDEDYARELLVGLKRKYHDARHHCYAFRLLDRNISRFSDDGEPSGTAGRPIMNVIESHRLYNVMIVVVRYFGGTLLGRNRLANAYRLAAIDMVINAGIAEKYIEEQYLFEFDYSSVNEVMSIVKDENLPVKDPVFDQHCSFMTSIRKGTVAKIIARLSVNGSFRYTIIKEI